MIWFYLFKLEDTSNQVEAVQNEIKLYQIETLALKEDTLELTSQALDGALGKIVWFKKINLKLQF